MTILLRQKPLPQVVRQIVQRDNGAWLDPEDMSTMYQDAAGTIPVTALEQPVGKWLDKSGNGNHATQSVTASRPTLSARYNLWLNSSKVNTSWSIDDITYPDGIVAPGGMPSSKVIVNSGTSTTGNNGNGRFASVNITTGSSIPYTISFLARAAECDYVLVRESRVTGQRAKINLITGKITSDLNWSPATFSVTAKPIDAGWWRIVITRTDPVIFAFNLKTGPAIGDGISGVYIANFQVNQGSTPLPYQRVNTATDYDSVGWPKYLKGDGIDDFYNLPFMNLYGNGVCSIVAARDAVSQATDTYVISERSSTDADPKYFPSRQLANGGNMDSYIVSDEGTVRLDTTGSAFSGAKLAAIRSDVDSGNNIKLFKDGAVVADDNYTRAGTLTLNNTTLGASVSTTTSNYANMRLYGLIITKSALSDTDRRRCEQFLASRLSPLGVTLS